ncbi:LysM peptidoglycan-binding domain-containing protein [Apibacter raozihei]|uniref:LysM peptidoglycan-binding domain-containing protein n=1 Tax=Apibacter raozihei TaxID=2500547 RepID=UPI000FE37497|nr:LysM peptidoglycan-binding domain-containing protein [Apibacter raozihei]
MPEYTYISHKVKKGETLWGIAKQYGVEEHIIVQANPQIILTQKGKYQIANLKEGQVLKIPQKAKEKTMQKQGVKAITGNPKPSVGNAEIYEVTQWYEATPTSLRNPAKVKWIIHKQNPQGHYIPHENSQKTGKGEFTFNEQSLGQKIKITGYLFTPELNNDSSLDLKVQQAEKRSIIGVALKDINLNPLPKPYRLALGQTFFVTVRTTNRIGNRVVIRLMKKKDPASQAAYKQGNSEEGIEYELYQQQTKTIKENGQATAYFQLDDFQLLMNPQKIQKYNVLTYLEESTETVINVTPVDAENTPTKKPPEKTEKKKEKKKEEDTIIYQGVSLLTEGWNNLKETYKILTTSDDPQIERVKLEIPEGKTQITYEDSLTLKIEGRNLKDKTLEYTLYEDDVASKDELQKGTHTLKGDIDSIKIQLNKEMYLKGGTSWFETQDGKHEIFVEIKLKGTKISKSSGIIEVDISQHKPDIPQNESVVTEGVLDLSENSTDCVCKELIWGKKLTCEERKKVIQVCSHIWGDNQKMTKANMLMAVMHLETVGTFSPSKENGKGYVGLIQFHSSTAHSLGTTYEALKKMTFIQQMDFVEKYLKQNKDKMKTLVDFYLQVLKPNAVGQGSNPNYVVFDESISVPDGDGSSTSLEQRMKNISREPWVTKYGYSSNPPFMKEEGERSQRKKWVYTRQRYEERWGHHDGKTYIWEVEKEIKLSIMIQAFQKNIQGNVLKLRKKRRKRKKGKELLG